MFQLILITFHEFFLVCDRHQRSIFFKAPTAHFHILAVHSKHGNSCKWTYLRFLSGYLQCLNWFWTLSLSIFLYANEIGGAFVFKAVRALSVKVYYIAKWFFLIISAGCLEMSKVLASSLLPHMVPMSGAYQNSWSIKLGVKPNSERCDCRSK